MKVQFPCPPATVTTLPKAKTLTYNGKEQDLVTAGVPKNGTIKYALGENETTAPTSGWSTGIPQGKDVGSYYVWYFIEADTGYVNSTPGCVTATIKSKPSPRPTPPSPAPPTPVKIPAYVLTAPVANTLTYDGQPQALITEGRAIGGMMHYAIGTDDTTAPKEGWTAKAPTATDAGTYFIWFKVVGDSDHKDFGPSYVGVATIIKKHSDNVLAIDEEKGMATVKDAVSGGTAEVPLEVITEGPIYRMYDPNRGEHFYTKDPEEAELLVQLGWIHESDSDFTVVDATEEDAIPVYRLYNPCFGGMHFYTTDAKEAKYLKRVGWNYEGISHYVYKASSTKGTPQYRLYNPNSPSGEHNWTSDESEVDILIEAGWINEGICWRIV